MPTFSRLTQSSLNLGVLSASGGVNSRNGGLPRLRAREKAWAVVYHYHGLPSVMGACGLAARIHEFPPFMPADAGHRG